MVRRSVTAISGVLGQSVKLPAWGRAFWQDPNDGELIVFYASGTTEVDFVFSSDSGNTWSTPEVAFYVDDFSVHDNFDTAMDPGGNVHCAHRFASSGCYSFIAKDYISGGWTQSGIIGRGFTTAGDGGVAKGFNGSIELTPFPVGLAFLDVAGPFPVARIVAKDASEEVDMFVVPNPFTSFPIPDSIGPNKTIFTAGQAGGFPIFSFGGPFSRQVIYSVDATGIVQVGATFGAFTNRIIGINDQIGDFLPTTLEGSGYVSRIPLGPTMAFSRTNSFVGPTGDRRIGNQEIIVTTTKHNAFIGVEVLTASTETQLADGFEDSAGFISNFLGRIPSNGSYASFGPNKSRAPLGVTINNFNEYPGDIFSRANATGTLIDFSWGSENNVVHMYTLINEDSGEQGISRIKIQTNRDFAGGVIDGIIVSAQLVYYGFSPLTNAISGVHTWGPAGREYTGGSGLFVTWNNFKALRHSARQFEGFPKQEAVVTQGSGLDSIERIVFWDYADSIDSIDGNLQLPTFVQHKTLDSGNNDIFIGPSASVGFTGAEIDNLFDDNTATSGAVSNGDSITLEFTTDQLFHRLEIAWLQGFSGPDMFEVNLDASLDGTTFTRVATIPEGFGAAFGGELLLKATAEYDIGDIDLNATVTHTLTPFVARFVKVSFGGAGVGTRDVREIRLYGAHNTAGGWSTEDFNKSFFLPNKVVFNRVEDFKTTREGEIPVGWTTYGDFDWFVRTSGGFSDGTQNGFVNEPSIYENTSNGRNDGSAARTCRTGVPEIPSGVLTSGVLEIGIVVSPSEIAFDGNTGRTISFDIRYDTVIRPPAITDNDPFDDQVIFQMVTETGIQTVFYPASLPQDPNEICGTNSCPNYVKYRTTTPTGVVTLRWIYQRGLTDRPRITHDETSVWIDNVEGVSTISQNTIAGFIKGRNFSSADTTGASGIFAFMTKNLTDTIPAYIKSDTASFTGTINAYIQGVEFASGSINAYVNAGLTEIINAYMQGTNFNSQINAFLANSGVSEVINAHLQNRVNERINAFLLGAPGATSTIFAYVATPKFSNINAFLKSPVFISGSINAFLQATGIQSDINAYMIVSGIPSGCIKGYINSLGATGIINVYISAGESEIINAYMKGALAVTGVINAYTSGLGFVNGQINAYMPGISGVASGSINAFIPAAAAPNSRIHGYIIGFVTDDSQCNFPLVVVPTGFIIPTGDFFT